ncbi:MAG: hypothetical protein JW932_14375 [Deltaproteobacteria bacterium]|nr:hypothetical protein [Deltaproteobacteria bacterium]
MKTKISGHQIQIAIGLMALFMGLFIYILYRPPGSSYLGSRIHQLMGVIPFKISVHEMIGGCLPDFLHPFAFTLICMALFPNSTQRQRGAICLFWFLTDLLFEIGQFFGDQIGRLMSFSDIFSNYFMGGTYDVLDIIAIGLGAGSAFLIGEITNHSGGKKKNETKKHEKRENAESGRQRLGAVLGISV